MFRCVMYLVGFGLLVPFGSAASATSLNNGGFDDGLNGWLTMGDVAISSSGQYADIADSIDGYAAIYQTTQFVPLASYKVELDFRAELSMLTEVIDENGDVLNVFPDIFVGTLVFSNDSDFDVFGANPESMTLFTLQGDGFTDPANGGNPGSAWFHYEASIVAPQAYGALLLELYDMNFSFTGDGASKVSIDNAAISIVQNTEVPEPCSMMLLGSGILVSGIGKLRRQRKS